MDAPIVVTGASGFVGRALCARLTAQRYAVRALTRASHGDLAVADESVLAQVFADARAVIHLAGRAHVMTERRADVEEAYRLANVVATGRVVRAATLAGVKAVVFASSVKVNGEATLPGRPFRADDAPNPQDAYARSKRDAERALAALAETASMRAVTLRLPLVYGPGVKGNFRRLWDAVAERQRLPLGAIHNRRSLLGLDNLVDALMLAMTAPTGTYLLADTRSVSTPDLVRAIATVQGAPARLASVPVALLRAVGAVTGRSAAIARLTETLEVDAQRFTAVTGWMPGSTLEQGLARMLGS
jgi:nucleoside-diphosphate-sugar epimerase